MNASPASATPRPTGAKSNIANASPEASARKVAITMLGGVPTSVTRPPSNDANASGMSTAEGLLPALLATRMAVGIRTDSTPTLFMNAESPAANPVVAAIWRVYVLPALDSQWASTSTAPEFWRPRLTTSTAATVTTAGWPNPANASSPGTTSKSTSVSSATSATAS